MKTLLALLWRALPYAIAIAVAAAVVWFIYGKGVSDDRKRSDAVITTLVAQHQLQVTGINLANIQALAKAEQDARDKEAADARAMAELDEKHFKEIENAKAEAQRTIDGLRSGAVRVRHQYTCAPQRAGSATGGVPQASGSTGMGDGGAGRGFGPADALAVIGAADEGDGWAAQLLACQAIVRRDRGQ